MGTGKHAAVLGWPVNHSLSPRLHTYWLKHYGIPGRYDAIAVEPALLEKTLRSLPMQGLTGVNITLPHKERALALMDEADAPAKRMGAVNTVTVRGTKLHGTNTDAYGFMANLKTQMHDFPAGKALILGAGGAARAVCAGLIDDGWSVSLANRTRAKAEALARFMNHDRVEVVEWNKMNAALERVSLLVNATSLGMKGQPPLNLPLDELHIASWVCDIVYVPEKTEATARYCDPTFTDLLARARDRGNLVVTGLGMLLYQAQPAFEAWFGVKPEVTDELHAHMLEAL